MYVLLKDDEVVHASNSIAEDSSVYTKHEGLVLVDIPDTIMEEVFERVARPVMLQQKISQLRADRELQVLTGKTLQINNGLCELIATTVVLYKFTLMAILDYGDNSKLMETVKQWEINAIELLLLTTGLDEFTALSTSLVFEAKHIRSMLFNKMTVPTIEEST